MEENKFSDTFSLGSLIVQVGEEQAAPTRVHSVKKWGKENQALRASLLSFLSVQVHVNRPLEAPFLSHSKAGQISLVCLLEPSLWLHMHVCSGGYCLA